MSRRRMQPMRELRFMLEYTGVRLLGGLARILHLRAASALGAGLGTLTWTILGFRRRVTRENLRMAFPRATEIDRMGLAAYRSLGRTMAEFLALERADPGRIARLVPIEGVDQIGRALARGRGAILVTGHFGNWELFSASVVADGYPVDVVVGPQSNPRVDRHINRVRRSVGVGVVPRGMSVRGVVRSLREGRLVGIVADQDAGEEGIFVDFFGSPASTPRGPALFALRLQCPIIFGVSVREGNGRYRVHLSLFLEPERSGDEEEDVRRLTEAYTRAYESWIRMMPDHYLWSHRRWKTRPAGGIS